MNNSSDETTQAASVASNALSTPEVVVKKGDIIVFMNHYYRTFGNANDGYDSTYVDHIAMVASTTPDKIDLIHSISSTKGHYHPQRQSGLCRTSLRCLNGQIQAAEEEHNAPERMYDVSFHLYRCHDEELAKRALEILVRQERVRLPYDEKRLSAKIALEEELDRDEDFTTHGKEQYLLDGRYRAIKFAARTPLPWTRTRRNGVGRGVTCSMAIILAFQIAELLAKELVESDYCSSRGWISDKYGALNPGKTYSPEYLQYLNRIRANSPAAVEDNEEPMHVSADFWKGDIPIEEFVHQSFPLDAKCTGAAGIAAYFLQNSTYWLNLGKIPAPPLHASPAQKIEEQKRRRNSFNDSLAQLTICAQKNPALVSPRLSPSPINIPSPVEQLWARTLALSSPVQLTRQLSRVTEVTQPIATSEEPEVQVSLDDVRGRALF